MKKTYRILENQGGGLYSRRNEGRYTIEELYELQEFFLKSGKKFEGITKPSIDRKRTWDGPTRTGRKVNLEPKTMLQLVGSLNNAYWNLHMFDQFFSLKHKFTIVKDVQ